MASLREARRGARAIGFPLLGFALIVYFAYHLVQGDRGLVAWKRLTQQLEEAKAYSEQVAVEKQELERRVALLRPDRLDPDMLDEQARGLLNLSRPDEVVILREGRPEGR